MGLDSHMIEGAGARHARELGQIAAQRHLGASEDDPLPPLLLSVQGEDALELVHGFRLEPVHGAFDHAVLALEIALEVHRELDIVLRGEPPGG